MATPISRKQRPIKLKQQRSINPVNYEKNAQHWDDEFKKIYQLLGDGGVINQSSVVSLIGGGSSSTPGTSAPNDDAILYSLMAIGT